MPNEKTKKTKLALKAGLLLAAALVAVGIGSGIFWLTRPSASTQTVTINRSDLTLELARTPKQKQRGLCCRDQLPADHGMLFIYDQPGFYQFWMKDTRLPLDIIWLNQQQEIVHIEHKVQPASYPQRYGSPYPAQYVLEVNAGYAQQRQLEVGQQLHLNLN